MSRASELISKLDEALSDSDQKLFKKFALAVKQSKLTAKETRKIVGKASTPKEIRVALKNLKKAELKKFPH